MPGNRERIMQEALKLFSQRGCAAVSMRDIAAEVGIKASSIYNHFDSKQSIVSALFAEAEAVKERLCASFLGKLERVDEVERSSFVEAGVFYITGYLHDPGVGPLLELLEKERFGDEGAERTWKALLAEAPMEHQSAVFRRLMERRLMPEDDACLLAAEYQALIVLAYFTGDTALLRVQLDRFYTRAFARSK